jgi:ABC-2 type transport system permease protein
VTAETMDRPSWSDADGPVEPPSRSSLASLTWVEMRKTVDTRSGFWLLLVIALLSLAAVSVQLIWGAEEDSGNLAGYFQFSLVPVALLLPVLGILAVTTEWSQRTALTTFTLVPERHRIVIAKIAASVVFAVLSIVTSLVVSVLGNLLGIALDRGDGGWNLTAGMLGQAVLLQVLGVVMGVAFGMLLMNTPTAIVLYFMLPTIWQLLTATISAIEDVADWLDLNTAMNPLASGELHGDGWGKLATSAAVWIVIPLVLGSIRLVRRELK